MLGELFSIASDFFILGIIPSIIVFTCLLMYFLNKKRYSTIKSLLIALVGAILTYLIVCLIIYAIILWLGITFAAILGIAIVIGIIVAIIEG